MKQKGQKFSPFHIGEDGKVFDFFSKVGLVLFLLVLSILVVPYVKGQESNIPSALMLDNNVSTVYNMYLVDEDAAQDQGSRIFMAGNNFQILGKPIIIGSYNTNNSIISNNTLLDNQYSNVLGGDNMKVYSDNITIVGGEENRIGVGYDNTVILGGKGNIIGGNSEGSNYVESAVMVGGANNIVESNQKGVIVVGGINNMISENVENSQILGGNQNEVSVSNAIVAGYDVKNSEAKDSFVFSDGKGGEFSPETSNAFYINTENGLGLNTSSVNKGISSEGAISLGDLQNKNIRCSEDALGVQGTLNGCLVRCTDSSLENEGKWELLDKSEDCLDKTKNGENPDILVNGQCGLIRYGCVRGISTNKEDTEDAYRWKCSGLNGGLTASCSEEKPKPVKGECGDSLNICKSGELEEVDSTQWNCKGENGGSSISCSVSSPSPDVVPGDVYGDCGDNPVHYVCKKGTPKNLSENELEYTWICEGDYNDSCRETKLLAGKCEGDVNVANATICGNPEKYEGTTFQIELIDVDEQCSSTAKNQCIYKCNSGYHKVDGACHKDCTFDGKTIKHGESDFWYKSNFVECSSEDSVCEGKSLTCEDGRLYYEDESGNKVNGEDVYQFSSCTLEGHVFSPEEIQNYPIEETRFTNTDDPNYIDADHRARGIYSEVYSYEVEGGDTCKISGTRYVLNGCEKGSVQDDEGNDIEIDFYEEKNDQCIEKCSYNGNHDVDSSSAMRFWYKSNTESCGEDGQEGCDFKPKQCKDGAWIGNEEYSSSTCVLEDRSFTPEEEGEYSLDKCDENGTCELIYSYSFSNNSCSISGTRYKLTNCNDGYTKLENVCYADCKYGKDGEGKDIYVKHGEQRERYQSSVENCSSSGQGKCSLKVDAQCSDGKWLVGDEEKSSIYGEVLCRLNNVSFTPEEEGEYPLDKCDENGICEEIYSYSFSDDACSISGTKYKLISCNDGYSPDVTNKKCMLNCDYQGTRDVKSGTIQKWYKSDSETCAADGQNSCSSVTKWCINGSWGDTNPDYDKSSCSLTERNCTNEGFTVSSNNLKPHMLYDNCTNIILNDNQCKIGSTTLYKESSCESGYKPDNGGCVPSDEPVNAKCAKTHNNCEEGTFKFGSEREENNKYTWECEGKNGGEGAYCTEDKIDGACLIAGISCAKGERQNYKEHKDGGIVTYYEWECVSYNGGQTASCLKSGTRTVSCGGAPSNSTWVNGKYVETFNIDTGKWEGSANPTCSSDYSLGCSFKCNERTDTVQYTCNSSQTACEEKALPKCTNLPKGAIANNNKRPEKDTSYTYNEDINIACTYSSCATNYTLNEKTKKCDADTSIASCTDLPSHAVWVNDKFVKTRNGDSWIPVYVSPKFSLDESVECSYKCIDDYEWNSINKKCEPKTKLGDCDINTKPDHAIVGAGKGKFRQTYDSEKQAYLPESVSWTYNANECGFVCDTDNHYIYNSITQKCELETKTVECDNTNVPKKDNSEEYGDHVAIQNSTVVVSWNSDANDWSDPAACIWYCEKDSETGKEYAKKDDGTGCEEVDRTMSCGNKPLNSEWKDGLGTYGQKKIGWNKYTPVISVSHYDKDSTTDERCTWVCEAGYTYNKEGNVETCKPCPAGSYCPGENGGEKGGGDGGDGAIDCANKNDLPSNAQFKTNQTSSMCDWECASGYTQEGNECKQDCSSVICNVKHGETCTTYEENSAVCPDKPNSKTLRCNNGEWGKWEEGNGGKVRVKDNNGPYNYSTYSQENKKCETSEYPLTSKSVKNASFLDCTYYTSSNQSCVAGTTIYKFICEKGFYNNENEASCTKCETGNYCPGDNTQHECENAPENAEYTITGETGENCTWNCKPGFYKSQDKNNNIICTKCETGNYCPGDNTQHECKNAPIDNAEYITTGETGENCTWDCIGNYTRSGDSCKANCSSKACESKHGESCTTYEKDSVGCVSTATGCQSKTLKCNDGKWVNEDGLEDTPYDNQNCSLEIKTCNDANYPLTDASGVNEANSYMACISYSINDNNQCTANGIKYAVGVCNKGRYKSSPNSCSRCEAGNYCPGSNAVVSCENKPQDNSHYVNEGEETDNCEWDCDANYYESKSGDKCEACPDGYTSKAGSTGLSDCCMTVFSRQYVKTAGSQPSDCEIGWYKGQHQVCADAGESCKECTNRPAQNSRYISNGANNDCEWRCEPGYYRTTDDNGKLICSECEEGYYCPGTNNDDGKHSCECGYKCPAKSVQAIACGNKMWSSVQSASCNNINVGWYGINACKSEPDDQKCNNAPDHSEYISNGINNDCAWQCEAGFYKNNKGNKCLVCPEDHYCPVGTTEDNLSSSSCGGDLKSNEGSDEQEDCSVTCKAGTYLPQRGKKCKTCTEGSFCGGGTFKYDETMDQGITGCPSTMKSDAGSKTIFNCYQSCNEHMYLPKKSAKCEVCPAGYYCEGKEVYSKFYYNTDEDTGIKLCEEGYYCPEAQGKQTCNPNSGDAKWSAAGSDEASDCTNICYISTNFGACNFDGVFNKTTVTWTNDYIYGCTVGGNEFSCKGKCGNDYIWNGAGCVISASTCGTTKNTCNVGNVSVVQQDDIAGYTRNCQDINKENINTSICYLCKNGYHLEGNECVASTDRTVNCEGTRPDNSLIKPGHGRFTQTWDGKSWSSVSWTYDADVCGYTCKTGYYGENCVACTGLPSNAKYIGGGDCSWGCDAGYYLSNGKCVLTPTGKYSPEKDNNAYSCLEGVQHSNAGAGSIDECWDYEDLDVYILGQDSNISHFTLMDRNLGASDIYNQSKDDPNIASYGYIYQWGNNYGFIPPTNLKNYEIFTEFPNGETLGNTQVTLTTSDEESKYTSNVFIKVNKWEWMKGCGMLNCSTTVKNLWGGATNTNVARKGPCPEGYHIPSISEFDNLLNAWGSALNKNKRSSSYSLIYDEGGEEFAYDFLLPPQGGIETRTLQVSDFGVGGVIYSSDHAYDSLSAGSHSFGTLGYVFITKPSGVAKPGFVNRASTELNLAYPVRCVKNSKNNKVTIHSNGGVGAVISVAGNKVVRLGTPSKGDLIFGGWYSDSGFTQSVKVGDNVPSNLYAKWSCKEGGYVYNGSGCVCDARYYENGGSCTECPYGYTSAVGSTSQSQCSRTITVRFYRNGATKVGGSTSNYVDKTCTQNYGSTCAIEVPSIERSGFTIVGWSTDSNSNATSGLLQPGTASFNSNTTYYATTYKTVTGTYKPGLGIQNIGRNSDCYYGTNCTLGDSCTIRNSATVCTIVGNTEMGYSESNPQPAQATCAAGYYAPSWDNGNPLVNIPSDTTTTATCTKCPDGYTSAVGSDDVSDCTDNTAPTITRTATSNNATYDGKGQWTKSDVSVVVKYSDNGVGINTNTLQWKDNKNNTSWQKVNNPGTSSYTSTWQAEGDRIGYYKICDKAGNCSETSLQVRIDKTNPTCTITGNPTSWKNTATLTVDYQTEINKISDGYSWDNSSYSSTKTKTISSKGNYTAYVKDSVGNVGSCSVNVTNIDTTAPNTSTAVVSYSEKSDLRVTSVGVTLICSDNESGVGSYFSWTHAPAPNSSFTDLGSSKGKQISKESRIYPQHIKNCIDNNYDPDCNSWYFACKDEAGNIGSVRNYKLYTYEVHIMLGDTEISNNTYIGVGSSSLFYLRNIFKNTTPSNTNYKGYSRTKNGSLVSATEYITTKDDSVVSKGYVDILDSNKVYYFKFVCNAGYYQDGSECKPCEAGTYSSEGDANCTQCDDLSFSAEGASACTACSTQDFPENRYGVPVGGRARITRNQSNCQMIANSSHTACVVGCKAGYYYRYSKDTGKDCTGKRIFQTCAYYDDRRCASCPAGYYCPDMSTHGMRAQSVDPEECPAGYYCPEESSEPTECTAGYYCPKKSSSPTKCPAGSYCPKGSSSPISCSLGTYSREGSSSCIECQAGYYCPDTKTRTPCGKGYYNPKKKQTSSSACTKCPVGSYCPGDANTNYTLCVPGTYTPSPGASVCMACDAGTYSSKGKAGYGSTSCSTCGAGECSDRGQDSCSEVCPGLATCQPSTHKCIVPSNTCFVAGTQVTMADGTQKDIENVEIGEKVLGSNGTINTVLGYDRPVLGERHLWSMNGSEYFVSEEHPFMTTEGWKSFSPEMTKLEVDLDTTELRIGDVLVTEDGLKVLETADYINADYETQLYNFVLDGDHTYYANGYLVHNKETFKEKALDSLDTGKDAYLF